ncbi:hypothetical protein P171DRAFT_125806 [Karstenula rhodostoma CBS 690.94]|uniref:Uncharacterized protein n=1 Tax=Karstenula rhodostoma CBS 690.94 TaxID=1392251 RepID=A0A9P4PA01_9PLEO|nr:hypothetical protein P171DRAFT_125806 [Karstenula rhodostoma CBS 690.94]
MAAGEDPPSRVDDDPSTAADALSLHTIADADVYASQEQEDGDFALALALEEQENERYARTQRISRGDDPNRVDATPEVPVDVPVEVPPPPYRDDPNATEPDNLPPYRDNPDAAPAEAEADEAAVEPAKRQAAIVRVLRKLAKAWLCVLMVSTFVTITIIVVVVVLVFVYGKTPVSKEASKQAAWDASGSSDYDLRLPKLYPALEKGTKDTCKSAWDEYSRSLSCHRMILSPAWDNGDAAEANAAGADPFFYSTAVCTDECKRSLNDLQRAARSCLNRTDRFDFGAYGNDGKAYFEAGKIEEGPLHVFTGLSERYRGLCRSKHSFADTKWGTCAADLWMNWGIVGGKNEAHLNGLDQFMQQTSVKKTVQGGVQHFPMLLRTGTNGTTSIRVKQRTVGPGDRETTCSACTVDWLARKMRSFEFGQVLDPATGEALGLSAFREKIRSALARCSRAEARTALRNADARWTELGWWCKDKPCIPSIDRPTFSNETMAVLHGWPEDSEGIVMLRELLEKKQAPAKVLEAAQVLYDGLRAMPCGYGFDPMMAKREILPRSHIVARLCSDPCRNALDRLRQQHGALFAEAARDRTYEPLFRYPTTAAEIVDRVCLSTAPGSIVVTPENLCAPGYAALGWPEWIFAGTYGGYPDPPIRAQILDVFSRGMDELADRLEKHPRNCFHGDEDCARTWSKMIAESACNTCAGEIFIGVQGTWKKTTEEFLGDRDVNGTAYVAAAKKGWRTCAKMYGIHLNEREWQRKWRERGLDVYD